MEKINNYGQLREHLLAVMDNFNDDKECVLNRNFTKGKYWNMIFSCCLEKQDSELVSDIIVKNTLTEFPEHIRCDFSI